MGALDYKTRRHRRNRLAAEMAATYHPRKHFRLGQDIGWHWQIDDPNTLYRRRNLLTYTGGSYASPWATDNSGATNPTVTANYAQAPDGTMTAARVQLNKTGGVFSRLRCVVAWPTGRQYVVSVYARTTSGSGTANVGLRGGDAGGTNIAVSGAWQRFTYPLGTLTVSADFQLLLWDSIAGNDETADILIWGAQLELGTVATEYQDVPTTWPQAYLDAVGAERIFAWTDTAGTIPAVTIGDGIGLLLGREYGGARGVELVTNGGFASDTWWTKGTDWVISGGVASRGVSASYSNLWRPALLTVGKTYQIQLDIVAISGTVVVLCGGASSISFTTTGRKSTILTCSGDAAFYIQAAGGAVTCTIDNISIREIPGTHLTQATGTAKPTLSARVNLLTYTEQFDNPYWAKINGGTGAVPVVTPNAGTDPLGGSTADRIVFARGAGTTLGDYSLLSAGVTGIVSGASHLGSVWMKSNTGSAQTVSLYLASFSSAIVNQVIGTTWTRVPVSLTSGATGMNFVFGIRGGAGYTSDQDLDILVWGADLRTADDAAKNIPAYQRVGATAADHDTDGFPHYAEGDGTDNYWASVATVDGSGTNKLSLVTALTKNTDAAIGIVLELTADSNISNGSFFQAAPIAAGAANLGFKARGTVAGPASGYNAATYAAPFTATLGLDIDLSASTKPNVVRPYINGVLDQGEDDGNSVNAGGNFANATLYVLSRAGASSRFNGRFYGSTGRFGPMGDSERNNLTRWWQKRIGTA